MTYPIQTLRDKRVQNERRLERAGKVNRDGGDSRQGLTVSPAQIPWVCGDALFLFSACEAHECVKLEDCRKV